MERPVQRDRTRLGLVVFMLAIAVAGRAADAGSPAKEAITRIRAQVGALLTRELREHWYPHAFDKEHGGFHQTFARDWSPLADDNRFLVYQARMTWTAAAFAGHSPEHRAEFADYARRGVAFLDQVMRDREAGGFHWTLDVDGHVSPRWGDEKHVYGTAFVVYAASKAYQVTHDERALAVARDAFDWLEAHAHDPKNGGYFEALKRDGTPIIRWDASKPREQRHDRLGVYYGFKSMNSHIHLLEALAELARIDARPIVKERLGETLALVRDRIAVDPGALNLYLTADWRATPAHDSFGHDVETAYLLIEAADPLGTPGEPRTTRMARLLVDHALDWGWDDENGGFYDKGEVFNGEAFARNKVWWTQAEGLNALLLTQRFHGATTDRYWNAFLKQWEFIERHLVDPEFGGWYMETTREGKLVGDGRKATQWKANYHTARALMNVETMLREMEAASAGRRRPSRQVTQTCDARPSADSTAPSARPWSTASMKVLISRSSPLRFPKTSSVSCGTRGAWRWTIGDAASLLAMGRWTSFGNNTAATTPVGSGLPATAAGYGGSRVGADYSS